MSLRSSGTCCAVRGCANNQAKLNLWLKEQCFEHEPRTNRECCCESPSRYSFHRLPRDEELRRMWLKQLNLKKPPKTLYVCSFHFVEKKPTEEHPHPTLWLGYERPPEKRRRVLKRTDSSVTKITGMISCVWRTQHCSICQATTCITLFWTVQMWRASGLLVSMILKMSQFQYRHKCSTMQYFNLIWM